MKEKTFNEFKVYTFKTVKGKKVPDEKILTKRKSVRITTDEAKTNNERVLTRKIWYELSEKQPKEPIKTEK